METKIIDFFLFLAGSLAFAFVVFAASVWWWNNNPTIAFTSKGVVIKLHPHAHKKRADSH